MDKKKVVEKLRAYKSLLEEHFELENVYLFGSYAYGKPRKDSDIDVAVVVDKIEGDYFLNTPLLWKLRRKIDDRIEPVLIDRNYDDADFLGEIKKYGIEIT